MKKIYYEKVGRRYIPVSEYDSDYLDSFPKGDHLVSVYPGGSSRRFRIDPAYAQLIAAGRVAENAICEAMRNASEAKPSRTPITERQRAAWENMKKEFGDEFFGLTLPASRDIAEAAVKAMMEEADKLMQNPSVRDAYEAFLVTCALTKGPPNG